MPKEKLPSIYEIVPELTTIFTIPRVPEPIATPRKLKPSNSKFGKKIVTILNTWFYEHIKHPYPSTKEAEILSEKTGLTITQVGYWFVNKRRRDRKYREMLKKNNQ